MTEQRERGFIDGACAIGMGTVAVRVLSVILAMGVGRLLGTSGLGTFFTLMAAAEVAGLIADLGVGVNLSRAVGPLDDRDALTVLREALALRMILAIPASAIFFAYVLSTRSPEYVVPGLLLAGYVVLNGVMVVLRQWAMGRARFSVAGRSLVVAQVTLVVSALSTAALGLEIGGLAAAECLAAAAGCVYLVMSQRSWLFVKDWARHHAPRAMRIGELLLTSLPLGLAGLLATAYSRFDLALVSFLVGDAEAGLYAAALQPYLACTALAGVLYSVVVPNVARSLPSGHTGSFGPWATATRTHVIGWLLAAVVYCVSELAVRLLYGRDFAAAVPVLQVMSFALPAVFFSNVVLARAVGEKRMSLALWIGVLGVVGTIGLELVLVPSIGALGAATSTLVVETAIAMVLATTVLKSPVCGFARVWFPATVLSVAAVAIQRLLGVPPMVLLPAVIAIAVLLYRSVKRPA